MTNRRTKHRVAEVVAHLKVALSDAAHAGGGSLPPMRHWCHEHGYSATTVHKALAIAQSEGWCRVVPRGGVVVTSESRRSPQAHAPENEAEELWATRSWERVRRAIRRDVWHGTYDAGGSLPSAKELRALYGVGNSTLKRALQALCTDGTLSRFGRGYRIVATSGRGYTPAIVLIGHADSLAELYDFTPRTMGYLQTLERLCAQRNLRLEYVSFRDAALWQGRAPGFLGPGADPSVLGVLLLLTGLYPQDIEAIGQRILSAGLPAAILDESGECPLPARLLNTPSIQSYSLGVSPLCGEVVGRHLASKGHRRVGYISTTRYHTRDARGDGVRSALLSAADGATFFPFVLETSESTPPDGDDLLGLVARKFTNSNSIGSDGSPTNPNQIRLLHEVDVLRLMDGIRPQLRSALDALVRQHRVTAVVAYNDYLAFAAQECLHELAVRVPQDVALVGFDDTPGACSAGLTSYNFSEDKVAARMVNHLLSGPPRRGHTTRGFLEVAGDIVERASSRGWRPGAPERAEHRSP